MRFWIILILAVVPAEVSAAELPNRPPKPREISLDCIIDNPYLHSLWSNGEHDPGTVEADLCADLREKLRDHPQLGPWDVVYPPTSHTALVLTIPPSRFGVPFTLELWTEGQWSSQWSADWRSPGTEYIRPTPTPEKAAKEFADFAWRHLFLSNMKEILRFYKRLPLGISRHGDLLRNLRLAQARSAWIVILNRAPWPVTGPRDQLVTNLPWEAANILRSSWFTIGCPLLRDTPRARGMKEPIIFTASTGLAYPALALETIDGRLSQAIAAAGTLPAERDRMLIYLDTYIDPHIEEISE